MAVSGMKRLLISRALWRFEAGEVFSNVWSPRKHGIIPDKLRKQRRSGVHHGARAPGTI